LFIFDQATKSRDLEIFTGYSGGQTLIFFFQATGLKVCSEVADLLPSLFML
jgi:hypothetical protein